MKQGTTIRTFALAGCIALGFWAQQRQDNVQGQSEAQSSWNLPETVTQSPLKHSVQQQPQGGDTQHGQGQGHAQNAQPQVLWRG